VRRDRSTSEWAGQGIRLVLSLLMVGLGLVIPTVVSSAPAADAHEVATASATVSGAPQPFVCTTPTVFVGAGTPNTTLFTQSQTTTGATFTPVGTASSVYNAIAYDPANNLIYGVSTISGITHAVVVDAAGAVTDLGAILGIPAADMASFINSGGFDAAGNYWVASANPTGTGSFYRVNLTTLVATPLITTQPVRSVDITFANGFFWGVSNGTQTIQRINPTTGVVTNFTTSVIPSGQYGAAWTYGNGNLGFDINTGGTYQLKVTNPAGAAPTFTLVATTPGPASSNNDGTSCVPGPVDLGTTKTGPAAVAPSGTLTWTLTVHNYGPNVSSGYVVTDGVPVGYTNVASSTLGCSVNGNAVQCIGGALAPGADDVITLTATAPSGPGCLTNTATVSGNEADTNTTNDSASLATCRLVVGDCNRIWYVTNAPVGDPTQGTYGYVDPSSGTWTPVGSLSDQSSSLGIDPTNPTTAYYAGWDTASAAPDGILYRLDLQSGVSTQLSSSPSPMFLTNRMAVAPNGTLWTMTSNGHIWSTVPTSTTIGTPVDHGLLVAPPSGTSGAPLTGGDIAFDGLGNMWIIASDSQLWTVSASELAGTAPQATFVGDMGTTAFPGLAFSAGSLYAATGGASTLFRVDPATGATTQTAPGGPQSLGDLASCAAPLPALTATKDVSPSGTVSPGAVLTYTIKVTNTGILAATGSTLRDAIPANTTYVAGSTALNGTTVPDVAGAFPYVTDRQVHSPGAFDGVIGPGGTATVTFQVRVDDPFPPNVTQVANQGFVNSNGLPETPTDWPTTPAPDDPVITPVLVPNPGLSIDKKVGSLVDVNGNGLTDVGDEVNYEFTVANTGNVTMTGVSVADPLLASNGISISCQVTGLAPGASTTCVASAGYVITQADVDSGAVQNAATGTGTPPSGPPVTTPPDTTLTPTDRSPAIELVKTADRTTLVAGQTITYTFTATNTGNTTLTGVVISEGAFTGSGSLSGLTCAPVQPAVLAPGDRLVCTATYRVTQADVDAGTVTNHADVTGTPPSGPAVTGTDQVSVPRTSVPGLSLDKKVASVVDVNGNGLTDAGDEINYVFELVNTGNVTLTAVAVHDPLVPIVICDPSTLAPGEKVECYGHAPYVISQPDADAGAVQNTATASGTPPTGPPTVTPPDATITPIAQAPGMALDKKVASVVDVDGDGLTDAGDQINYEFIVTNTGNVTLTTVAVSDPMLSEHGIGISCPFTALAPGDSGTCSSDSGYVITDADVRKGVVRNVATVAGSPPDGPATASPPDTVDYPVPPHHSGGIPSLPNTGATALMPWTLGGGVLLPMLGALVIWRTRAGAVTYRGKRVR
jgi:uncharacterized repeat protein (TIGR01451 family)